MEYAYCLDPNKKPDYIINTGEVIKVISENAFGGDADNELQLIELMQRKNHHPLVGPIYVNGIEAGMNIEISIVDIQVNDIGYQCCSRSSGVLKMQPFERNFKKLLYYNGEIKFDNICVYASPSLGVIGTATDLETRSGRLGYTGGNIDLSGLGIGAKIILPCEKEGALIYLGDLHMLQGNGEISGIAAEVGGIITFSVNIAKNAFNFPIIETKENVILIGYGGNMEESIRQATENAIIFLCCECKMRYVDAYMILSLVGNILLGHSTGKVVSSGMMISKVQFNKMKNVYYN